MTMMSESKTNLLEVLTLKLIERKRVLLVYKVYH